MYFDYFYHRDGEVFRYIRLPSVLMEDALFKIISIESKVLYAYMLNRVSLSYKNNWIDDKGRVYVYFTIEYIKEIFSCSNDKASNMLKELEKIGLIERKRQGLGKPNIIYVKDFLSVFQKTQVHEKSEHKTSEKQNSELPIHGGQEFRKSEGNYIELRKNENRNTEFRTEAKQYGMMKNVVLTEGEYNNLKNEMKESLEEYIDRLSLFMESTGKTYKDHKATLLLWFKKDQKEKSSRAKVLTREDYEEGEYL